MKKTYKEFMVYTEPFNPDVVSSVMWELNISGINEEDNNIKVFADGENVQLKDIAKMLQRLKEEELITNFRIGEETLEYRNWNEEWEKKTNVIKVSDSIVIKPTFREYTPTGKETVIVIDPKMSFGTGEHQTTRLSLILLQKYINKGDKVLDAGTGTGILAIGAVKFGADYALGIDIDEWSVPNFEENVKLNSTGSNTEVRNAEISSVMEKDFDLIAANIQKNILIDICPEIYSHLKVRCTAILSGLLEPDENDIKEIYSKQGFIWIETLKMDEWIGMVFRKG